MKRINHVEKYFREKYRSLAAESRRQWDRYFGPEKQTTDFGSGGRPQVVMLREKTWRIEMSRSKAKRFWRQHKIAIVATLAVLFTGLVTRYVLIGFASTVDFYPSSCLGNWENVQNALGKPDLSPGSPPSSFTALNSAVFGTSTAQMFCGNFSGSTDINTLMGKSFQGADLVLSWSVIFPEDTSAISADGGGGGNTGGDGNGSSSDDSALASSTPPDVATTTDSASSTSDVVAPAATDTTETTNTNPPALTSTPAPDAGSGSNASTSQTTPPDTTPPPASTPTPIDNGSDGTNTATPAPPPAPAPDASSPSSWLINLVGVAYADETSSIAIDASTTELADSLSGGSSTSSSSLLTVSSSAQEGIPTRPEPAPININTSMFQNIILPSSTADDALAIVYSTDGVTWQPLININSSNWQQARYPIPISSWQELQHLQVAFVGLGASSSPQIFLDAAGVEVSYIDTPEATTEITSSTPTVDNPDQGDTGSEVGTPATSSWTPPSSEDIIQKKTISETDVFQQGAHQQCVVAPFSQTIAPGGSTSFSLQLFSGLTLPTSTTANTIHAVYQTQVGSLPVGVSATITDGKASDTSSTQSIHISASASAPTGSYSVLVIYRERQDDESMRSTGCQMNVVVR